MARRVEEIARIHLEPRLVRPELEAAPRCRILDPRHQMLVGGHLAADDPIMVVAAAEDDLLVAGVADALPNGGRLAEIEHRARDRTIFAGRNRARIGRQIAFRGNGHDMRSEEHTSELPSLMRIPYA